MIRLAISVEGQTEEEFVKSMLYEHLMNEEVAPTPILLGRARGKYGGGNVTLQRLASEMAYLLSSFDVVTSFVDFYGFRDKADKPVEALEQSLREEICHRTATWLRREQILQKALPYIQLHEFEGLLFSDVAAFKTSIGIPNRSVEKLRRIRAMFTTPEDINDNNQTAPSKRIASIVARYDKVVDGPLVAMETGLDVIRNECPRFHNWLNRLESLGSDY